MKITSLSGGRRSGKTLRMVQELPYEGAIVFITSGQRHYIQDMICSVRGNDYLKKVHIIVPESHSLDAARGSQKQAFVDHYVWDWLHSTDNYQTIKQLHQFIDQQNWRNDGWGQPAAANSQADHRNRKIVTFIKGKLRDRSH